MSFVVLETGGKQYKVSQGQVFSVEKLDIEVGQTYKESKVVLCKSPEGDILIGKPTVDGVEVNLEILEHKKDKKIIVFKKKRRQNYRRKNGHRQRLTVVRVADISIK